MTDNSDYTKPRTNLYDLLPEVYKSGVNRSVLEASINRFLTKSQTDRVIGYIGQGNPNAAINRQIAEPTPQRQAYQLQPMIYSKIGTVEHMASFKDIENELTRLGVDPLLMQEWGDALAFNWAPPIDFDKLINYRNYYWYNEEDPTEDPQYLTIRSDCVRAQAALDEYNLLLDTIGALHAIVGLDAMNHTISIATDLTGTFTEGFIFYVKNSTNSTINAEFYTVVSSAYNAGSDATVITVNVSGSPVFDDSIIDGDVSLEEGVNIYEAARDCFCAGEVGWSGGLWDDNQVGTVIWNTQLILSISYPNEAAWLAAHCPGSPTCPEETNLWYDTSTDELKQYNGSAWVVVQRNFGSILAVTTGGNTWDYSKQCHFASNDWITQNKWLHQNQVPNFSIAKQAQIPIIEFISTIELNAWTKITYIWQYRPASTEPWESAAVARPNLFELIGVDTYTIDVGLQEIVFDARYGDLTPFLEAGTEIILDGTTDNDGTYTIDYSFFCEEVAGQKYQTRIRLVETLTSTTADGIITPAYTSRGDAYEGVHVHWSFVQEDEAFPTVYIPLNPMLELPTNPPLPAVADTYWQYTLGLFAEEILATTKSLGTLTIIGASSGSPTYWEIAGDHTAAFSDPNLIGVGGTITVSGNLGGGNTDYTITSVSLVGGNTRIGVAGSIPAAAVAATTKGELFAHWTFTFDSSLRDETLEGTNDLRVYIEDTRQYGNYDEIAVTGSPTPDCSYVGGILIRAPLEQYQMLRVEVGAAACCDIGYNWVGVRTNTDDGSFNPATDLECVSLVQFKKLEQVKSETNQYPLFDLFDVEGNPLNVASRIFAFQESQSYPVNTLVNKRIVTSSDGRDYYFEQYLTPEDNGVLYAYREASNSFWYDSDNEILYQWKNGTWNPKIVTTDFSTSSTTACYVAPVVSNMVPGSPYIDVDGMLWFNTNNNSVYVSDGSSWTLNSLITADVVISDADPGLNSIWRTGPTDTSCADSETYVPEWVDGDRNPLTVGDPNGDWEIPDQLYFNPLHENRKVLSYTDLYTHFTSVINAQDVPPGFLGTPAEMFHAILDVNYGAGGTMKEYNNSYDTFLSSIFNQTVNPVELYEFAHDAYENAISQLKEYFRRDASVTMVDTTPSTVADLSTALTDAILFLYESNDIASLVYGDTTAYNATTGLGVKNWPATLPFFDMVYKVEPQQIYDPTIGLNEILHHDGHYSHIEFNPTTIETANRRIISTTDTRSSNPTGKMGAAVASTPPDSFLAYQTMFGNTSALYWYDTSNSRNRIMYRMSAVAVGEIAPAIDLAEGAFWYDTAVNQLKILQSGSWVNDPSVGPGYLSDISNGYYGAWELIDFNKLFSDVIYNTETRLWEAAPEDPTLVFDFDTTFAEDPVLTDQLFEEQFASFVSQAEILDPYANEEYMSDDPYTWNYKTATVSGSPPSLMPQVGASYVSGGDWRDVYQKQLGTPYPHFEPWVLQGYYTKPDWWDTSYPAVAGRRWSSAMWTNIVSGIVPAGELLADGSVSTGVAGEATQYNYIPVNMDTGVVKDGAGNTYSPDALLPPVTILPITKGGIPSIYPIRSIWTAYAQVPNAADDYNYDDAGTVEWAWENSSQYLYDSLKVAFKIQPIRFIHSTLGIDFVYVGCLNVDQNTQKVYAHQNTLFHGDLQPDNTIFRVPGTLQWYTNYNRASGYDISSSNFRRMWSGWDTYLSYQFSTVIDTTSLILSSTIFDVVEEDYQVTLKRSPGIEDHTVDALKVSILKSPPTLINQDTQSQWTFNVSSYSPTGRPMPYYGSQTYNFTVDIGTDVLTLTDVYGRTAPWTDGQAVYLSSTEFLPSPLLADTPYYVTKVAANQYTLSTSPGGPIVDILSAGTGTQSIFQVQSTFTALEGATTSANWYHVELDTDLVLTATPPTQINGFQNLISFIDGYAAYAAEVDNFRFNHAVTDIDAATGKVTNWQLEEERLINWAYSSRKAERFRRDQYPVTALASTDTFTYSEQAPGGWTTGTVVDVFTEGTLPQPLVPNTTYYIIQDTSSTFKLAITSRNARNGIAIDLLTDGVGDLYVRAALSAQTAPTFEVNPFKYNLWIATPEGIVSDLVKGPFADVRTNQLLLDQYGTQLPSSDVLPLREDQLTRINVQEGIENTVSPIAPPGFELYNNLHLTSAHIYIDGYEHVILFQDYAATGNVIYDSFLGLNTAKFDIQMDRSTEFSFRPNLGGFVLVDNSNTTGRSRFSRNIEGQVDDLRYAYDTYRTVESNRIVAEARASLGYDGARDYLNAININPKSQFIFWRGMIQQKGSVNSVKAFINSRRFVDAKIDEYWARKIADFGNANEYTLPEVQLFASDGNLTELRLEFVDPNETASTGFIGISNNDQDRWYEYPNQKEFFDANGNMYFNAEATSLDDSPSFVLFGGHYYYETPEICDTVVATYYNFDGSPHTDQTERLIEGVDYIRVNSRLIDFGTTNPTTVWPNLKVYTINPAEQRHNPAKVRDAVDDLTLTNVIIWDPARGHHYPQAIQLVDVTGPSDPALIQYGYSDSIDPAQTAVGSPASQYPYGSNAVNTTWLDSSLLAFVPYSDTAVFTDTFERLRRWGKLADFGDYKMYQWTESDVPPSEYNAIAEEQEGDITIAESQRVNGRVREVVYEGDGGSPIGWTEYPFEVEEYASRIVYGAPSFTISSAHPATLYVNGLLVGTFTSSAAISAEISGLDYTDADHIHVAKYYPTDADIDDITWKKDTPYTTEQKVIDGEPVTKYYFWVGEKTVRQTYRNKAVTMVEAQIQLNKVPVPYVIVQNIDTAGSPTPSVVIPRRYTQAIIRGLSAYVNADDRYTLRFTRDFTYRDNLSTTDPLYGPDSIQNRHQEWSIFRQEQQYSIDRDLWNILTESIIGQTLASLGGTAVRVPSLNKELYDDENDTSTRIGFGDGQAFCDGASGWEAILSYLQDGSNDFAPIDINTFFDTWDPLSLTPRDSTDAQTIADMMDDIYNTFTYENVNRMWFSALLTAALPYQHRYADLFKTSFIALHGIRILETSGLFDD